MATTNFEEWLSNLEDDSVESILSLYKSVSNLTELGGFKCSQSGEMKVVESCYNKQKLFLANDKIVKSFLDKLNSDYAYKGDMNWLVGHYDTVDEMQKKELAL